MVTSQLLNQDAVDVQLIDLGGGGDRRVEIVDVVNGKLTAKVDVSKSVEISSARRTVAFVDRQSGKGWVRQSQGLAGFTTKAEPTVTGLGQKAAVVVGADGTAHFLNRAKSVVTPVSLDASGVPVVGSPVELKGQLGDKVEMTAVGSVPVVLDRVKSLVFVPRRHHGADVSRACSIRIHRFGFSGGFQVLLRQRAGGLAGTGSSGHGRCG